MYSTYIYSTHHAPGIRMLDNEYNKSHPNHVSKIIYLAHNSPGNPSGMYKITKPCMGRDFMFSCVGILVYLLLLCVSRIMYTL